MFGLGMTVFAIIAVLVSVEEPELYGMYFIVAAFNVMCLGVTYYMRKQLDVRVAERAKEKQEKKKWDKLSQKD